MIVQPDFPDHYKTQALVDITKDEAAPMAVLRLWAHCQNARRWQFPNMTPAQLAALCAWGSRKPACHTALMKAGFLKRLPEGGFEAHQWDQQNGKLIANWTNGPKGGRPKKGPKKGGDEGVKNNPAETQGLSDGNPPETDKRRSEKRRSDVLQSNRGGTGEGVEGGRVAELFAVPVFGEIDKGAFHRELKDAVSFARGEVARLRSLPEAWEMGSRERGDYDDDVAWHEKELAACGDVQRYAKLEKELAELKANRFEKFRKGLIPEAKACVSAWEAQIVRLEKAMGGAKG